jgi:hypothetical protein
MRMKGVVAFSIICAIAFLAYVFLSSSTIMDSISDLYGNSKRVTYAMVKVIDGCNCSGCGTSIKHCFLMALLVIGILPIVVTVSLGVMIFRLRRKGKIREVTERMNALKSELTNTSMDTVIRDSIKRIEDTATLDDDKFIERYGERLNITIDDLNVIKDYGNISHLYTLVHVYQDIDAIKQVSKEKSLFQPAEAALSFTLHYLKSMVMSGDMEENGESEENRKNRKAYEEQLEVLNEAMKKAMEK